MSAFGNPKANAEKDWERAVVFTNQKNKDAIISYMKIIYFEAKENLATRKTKALKDLCIDLGVDCLKSLQINAKFKL